MRLVLFTLACAAGLISTSYAQETAPTIPGDEDHAALYENETQRDERMSWWRNAKFGMFIHYGLYSGLGGEFQGRGGGGEWIQHNLNLDSDTYAAEAIPLFTPSEECAEQWAALAEQAGCRYMVLTSKHHEGFALFDTATTDFNSVKTAGRDVVKLFTEAARKHGLRVGFYHSVIDWHHPSYDNTIFRGLCYPPRQAAALKAKGIPRDHKAYQQYLHAQVRELMTKYGKIDVIWWDYSQGALSGARGWQAPKLIEMVRELQPGIIMNNRLYAYGGLNPASDAAGLDLRCGDFTTPEKRLLQRNGSSTHDWETCMTLGNHWGYNKKDAAHYKTPVRLIRCLQQCAAYGGNLLLNVSPRGDGSLTPEAIELFQRIGRWMEVNSESIYGSKPVPSITLPEGWLVTIVGEDTYLFAPHLNPKKAVTLRIPAHEIDTVKPEVLGQPESTVEVRRVEEPGEDEPHAFMEFTIPAAVWQQAVEGLPVIKLINAH